jgi:hypothetical protein
MKLAARIVLAVLVLLTLDACHASHATGKKMGVALTPFPCNDASTGSDPNNCGACGTLCGTYAQGAQGGVNFVQGTCTSSVCAPYPVNLTATVGDGGSSTLDCFDLLNGSLVSQPSTGQAVCVNVATGNQNCGGLGYKCNGVCTDTKCGGNLTVPSTLTLKARSPINQTTMEATTVTGGAAPFRYTFAPNGNNSGGTINATTGSYTSGSVGFRDTLQVFDANGNYAIAGVTVASP